MEIGRFGARPGYEHILVRCTLCGTDEIPISAVCEAYEGKASAVPADWVNDYILERLERDKQHLIDVFMCTKCHAYLMIVGKQHESDKLSVSLVAVDASRDSNIVRNFIRNQIPHFPRVIAGLVTEFLVPSSGTFPLGLPIRINDREARPHELTGSISSLDGIFSIASCYLHSGDERLQDHKQITLTHLETKIPFDRPANVGWSRIISMNRNRCGHDFMTFYVPGSNGSVSIWETSNSECRAY